MGTETEYGITVPGNPGANAMLISSQIVNAYAQPSAARSRRPRWDFEEENPLRDARGFDLSREVADPSQLTDEDVGLANVILTNGARFYVDHAHPEYSGPECTNPRDALIWDRAGERIMAEASRRAAQIPNTPPIHLYKNNTDNKGASYGTHENYLMRRETPFADIVRHLTPFFVSRQVVGGSGRVGIGQDGHTDGFQISQRADYFEVEVGLETTLKRPIINTRDEPHAVADKYRRLHVIIGDANLAEVSTYLKLGTTCARAGDDRGPVPLGRPHRGPPGRDAARRLARPVAAPAGQPALRSHAHRGTAADGVRRAGAQVRRGPVRLRRRPGDHRRAGPVGVGAQPARVRPDVAGARARLGRQEADPRGLPLARRAGLGRAAAARRSTCSTATSARRRGSTTASWRAGRFDRVVTDAEIDRAVTEPPEDTRAYFRGGACAKYPEEVAAASWDSVIFDLPGHDSLQRVPTLEPLRGTKEHVGELLDRCDTASELVAVLTGG